MSLIALAIAAGAAGLGGTTVVGRLGWIARLRASRALAHVTPLTATTADGETARVVGIVRAARGEPLTAPISGRACLAYRTILTASQGKLRSVAAQGNRIETSAVAGFELETALGVVVVDGAQAILAGRRIRFARPDPGHVQHLMLANGWIPRERSNARVYEEVVEVGARVEVAGVVMRDAPDAPPEGADGELGFRDERAAQVRLAGDQTHPLIVVRR